MIHVAIETTSRCNLRCAMCGHPSMTRTKADMTWDVWTKVVDDIRANGHTLAQMHFMGEPLLDGDFVRRIAYLAQHGVKVRNSFSTNCTLLTPDIADRLIDAGFAEVHATTNMLRLCIDSMDPAVYDQLRIGGDHAKVVENALGFIAKLRGRVKGLQIQRLMTDRNPRETDSAYKVFGVPVRVQPVGLHQDKTRDLRCVKDHRNLRHECNILFRNIFWVTADGRATGCCLDADVLQPCGDLHTQTVAEAFAGRNNQRTSFLAEDWDALPQCGMCIGNTCTGKSGGREWRV